MNPMIASGLISGGGGIIGGIMNNRSAQQQAEQAYSLKKQWALEGPGFIRKGAEDAGFNPLVFAGSQTYNPSPVAVGSNGVAEAAASIGRGIEERYRDKTERENARIAQENERIRLGLERQRLEETAAAKRIDQEIALARLKTYQQDIANRGRNASVNPYMDPANPQAFVGPNITGTPGETQPYSAETLNLPFGLHHFFQPRPGRSTSDAIQRVYGEPGEWMFGVLSVVDDILYNSGRGLQYLEKTERKTKAYKPWSGRNPRSHKEGW